MADILKKAPLANQYEGLVIRDTILIPTGEMVDKVIYTLSRTLLAGSIQYILDGVVGDGSGALSIMPQFATKLANGTTQYRDWTDDEITSGEVPTLEPLSVMKFDREYNGRPIDRIIFQITGGQPDAANYVRFQAFATRLRGV